MVARFGVSIVGMDILFRKYIINVLFTENMPGKLSDI